MKNRYVAQPLIDEQSFKLVPQKNSYTNYEESGKITLEGSNLVHNEFAVIRDNGNRNGYTINFSLMNSKAYHDKFENLSASKQVNEGLYRQAVKILGHRSGTEYEDIAILDARTGKLLVENNSASGNYKFQCGLTRAQYQKLQNSDKKFEILHNHPSNSIPSTSDIIGLFKRENAVASTVVCHNGDIHRMEKIKQLGNIDELVRRVYKDISYDYVGYPNNLIEHKVSCEIIHQLEILRILKYRKVV